MKVQWKRPEAERLWKLLERYKYVWIIIVAGILLLLWPSGEKRTESVSDSGVRGVEEDFDLAALEEKLSQTLSQVEGAGQVTVTLTVKSGMEQVLATDRTTSVSERGSSVEEETVILSGGSGEEALLITQRYPVFQGAVVVCEGGGDAEVQLLLTRAVSALTGLGADRITVCKGG